jgi:hypothetical protein
MAGGLLLATAAIPGLDPLLIGVGAGVVGGPWLGALLLLDLAAPVVPAVATSAPAPATPAAPQTRAAPPTPPAPSSDADTAVYGARPR